MIRAMLIFSSFCTWQKCRRIAARLGVLMAVWGASGLFLFCGCSRPETGFPNPDTSGATTTPAATAPDIPDVDRVTAEQEKATVMFAEYVKQLRAGDLIQASAHLAVLKSELSGENMDGPFWADNLPATSRLTLLVSTLCTACTDGACVTCHGNSLCPTCDGTGLCTACKGSGGEIRPCVQCVCKTCGGGRFCAACKGRRFIACAACAGSGVGQTEQKFEPCPSCGGLGYKEGLRGAGGIAARVKCIRCNGTKGVFSTINHPCPTCQGAGRQPCASCKASGVCAVCQGLGRQSDCSVCNGQGRYLDPCTVCNGAKNCVACNGAKLCRACDGQGVCRECQGRNVAIRYRLPIDRGWLKKPDARLLLAGPDKPIAEPLADTTAVRTVKGRTVSVTVPNGSLLWISPIEDLRQIRAIFKPAP